MRADLIYVNLEEFRITVTAFLMFFLILSAAFILSLADGITGYE